MQPQMSVEEANDDLKKRLDKERLEEEKRRQYEKENREREEFLALLKVSWFFRFMKLKHLLKKSGEKDKNTMEELEAGLKIHFLAGQFMERAKFIFKQIVEEQALPEELRKYRCAVEGEFLHKLSQHGQSIFMAEQIIFKVKQRLGKGDAKELNQEFLCLNTLCNISFQREDMISPLACFFEYLGYKAICLCVPPLNEENVTTGRFKDGYHIYEPNIELLEYCSSMLNMAPIHYMPVYLSSTIEVHKIEAEIYNDVYKMIAQKSHLADTRKDSRNQWLLFNLGVFWPRVFKTSNWFRPEFVLSWEKGFGDLEDYYNLADASKKLNSVVVDQIVKRLFDVEVLPIDSSSISQIVHASGANVSLIGLIMRKIIFPHVKEILLIEMIARTAKRIFLRELAELIAALAQEPVPGLEGLSQEEARQLLLARSNRRLRSYFEDFMNLMLGNSEQGKKFYLQFVYPQMEQYFNLDPSDFNAVYPPEVTNGGLVHALVYHTGLDIEIKNGVTFFDQPAPFKPEDIRGFNISHKNFNFEGLLVKKYCQAYHKVKGDPDKKELCARQLELLIRCERAFVHSKVGSAPSAFYLSELADLVVDEDEGKAIQLAREAIDLIPAFHAESIRASCLLLRIYSRRNDKNLCNEYFDKANNCLQFHVGGGHFLHVTLYNTQAFECTDSNPAKALSLLKQSMFICMKILGPIHRTTAAVLMQVASAFLKMNKRNVALEYLKQAEIIYEDDKKSVEYAEVCMQIAKAEQGIGRTALAIEYAEKAAKVWTEQDMILKCWHIYLEESEKAENLENAMLAVNNMEKYLGKGAPGELFEFLVTTTLRMIFRKFNPRLTQMFYQLYVSLEDRLDFLDVEASLSKIRARISEDSTTTIPKFVKLALSEIVQSFHLVFTNEEAYLHLLDNLQKSGEIRLEKYVQDLTHFFVVLGRKECEFLLTKRITVKS